MHLRTDVAGVDRPVAARGRARRRSPSTASPTCEPDVVRGRAGLPTAAATPRCSARRRWTGSAPTCRPAGHPLGGAGARVRGRRRGQRERARHHGWAASPSCRASVFDGVDYAALGHLHGAQTVARPRAGARYSGSPLAFSFSEEPPDQGVWLVELGDRTVRSPPSGWRPRCPARCAGHAAGSTSCSPRGTDLATAPRAWVQVDAHRSRAPAGADGAAARRFPHVLALAFAPGRRPARHRPDDADPARCAAPTRRDRARLRRARRAARPSDGRAALVLREASRLHRRATMPRAAR